MAWRGMCDAGLDIAATLVCVEWAWSRGLATRDLPLTRLTFADRSVRLSLCLTLNKHGQIDRLLGNGRATMLKRRMSERYTIGKNVLTVLWQRSAKRRLKGGQLVCDRLQITETVSGRFEFERISRAMRPNAMTRGKFMLACAHDENRQLTFSGLILNLGPSKLEHVPVVNSLNAVTALHRVRKISTLENSMQDRAPPDRR